MNLDKIREIPWGTNHGRGITDEDYLGMCMMYYTLAYTHKAKVCICLGSDSGLIPAMMKEAQIDAGIKGEVYLVDGNMPESGWGKPYYFLDNGEPNPEHPFIKNYDCNIWLDTTINAWSKFMSKGIKADYIHIDASHTYIDSQLDFAMYQKILAEQGVITMHDCTIYKGVSKTIEMVRSLPDWDVIELANPSTKEFWQEKYIGKDYDVKREDFDFDSEDQEFREKYWDPFGI